MRALIYGGIVSINFIITLLNFVLVRLIFNNWLLQVLSLMWVSFFYTLYFVVLTDWYLNTNYEEIDEETKDDLAALENLKWYGIPAFIGYGFPGFIISFVDFKRDFHIYYDSINDVRLEVIRRINKLFKENVI